MQTAAADISVAALSFAARRYQAISSTRSSGPVQLKLIMLSSTRTVWITPSRAVIR